MKTGGILAISGVALGLLSFIAGLIIAGIDGGSGPQQVSMFINGLGVLLWGGALAAILIISGSVTWLISALCVLCKDTKTRASPRVPPSMNKETAHDDWDRASSDPY
jgi:hypothetical protein